MMRGMCGILFFFTVILIVLTILFLPTSLIYKANPSQTVILDLTFFRFTIYRKDKRKKKNDPKRYSLILKTIQRLIKRSRITIKKYVIANSNNLSFLSILSPIKMIFSSSLLAYLKNNARSFRIESEEYLVSNIGSNDIDIEISIDFFLYELFISLMFLAYLDLKSKVRKAKYDRERF